VKFDESQRRVSRMWLGFLALVTFACIAKGDETSAVYTAGMIAYFMAVLTVYLMRHSTAEDDIKRHSEAAQDAMMGRLLERGW
jgi:hypothetical protein